MDSEIILPQDVVEGGLSKFDSKIFDQVSTAGFLPRLQLYGGNSDAVKEGKIPIAHYGLQYDADRIEDLGPSIDIAVVSWRPKALRIGKGEDPTVSYFNIANPEFGKVQAESNIQDSGCMFGPEYLVWLPSKSLFATFYMGSKTARREAPRLQVLLGKAATLKAKLITGTKFKWHGPVALPCTTPLGAMPEPDDLKDELAKFSNPQDSVVEKVEEPVAGETRER